MLAPPPMGRQQSSISRSLKPPVGGWNTRDALADMPADHAVFMDNWFPGTSKVTLRKGFTSYATGMTGDVETLMTYTGRTGSQKLFAANGTSIYDVTSSGAVGAAAVGTTTNARWQHVMMGTSGGQFLFCCNGAKTAQTYDGASWANTTLTGPTTTSLIWCQTHQRRLWVGEKESLSAWYGGTDSIAGAFTEFPLYGVAVLGGYIMAAGTWSRDGGAGPDDYIVFITSEGEAIIYAGTDPSSASTWQLVGVYRIGKPIGRRCMIKAGSDLIVVTQDGFLPMSHILAYDRSQADVVALSSQINSAVNTAVLNYGTNYGWQPFLYPKGTMLIFNIPISSTVSYQYVFNTITKAPCRFVGVNSKCWGLLGDNAYFGGTDGKTYKFDNGTSDNGANIAADMLPAFNHFGSPATTKAFKLAETVIESDGDVSVAVDLCTDYVVQTPDGTPTSQGSTGSLWDTGTWDSATWGGGSDIYHGWRGIAGVGRAAALRVRVATNAYRPSLISSRLTFTAGGQVY